MLRVELIEVGNAIMVLVVGQHGGVEKLLVERPDDLPSGDLRTLERRFADRFAGKPIAEAQAIALRTAAESPGAEREMLLGVSDVLAHMQAGAEPTTSSSVASPTSPTRPRTGVARPCASCSRRSSASRRCCTSSAT